MKAVAVFFLLVFTFSFFPSITFAEVYVWFPSRPSITEYSIHYCSIKDKKLCQKMRHKVKPDIPTGASHLIILGKTEDLNLELSQYNVVLKKEYPSFQVQVAEVTPLGEGELSDPVFFNLKE